MQLRNKCRKLFLLAAMLGLVLAVAGCGAEKEQQITLAGKLTYPGDTKVPPESGARISMVEQGAAGGDKRIVAERSLHNIGQKPIDFDIVVDRGLINADGRYALRAEILDNQGDTRWTTKQPVTIKPLESGDPIQLALQPTAEREQLAFTKYRCEDGFHFGAATTEDKAVARLGNRRLALDAARNDESSQLFRDSHGNELRVGETTTDFNVDGGAHENCQVVKDHTPAAENGNQSSPSNDDLKYRSAEGEGDAGDAAQTPNNPAGADESRDGS